MGSTVRHVSRGADHRPPCRELVVAGRARGARGPAGALAVAGASGVHRAAGGVQAPGGGRVR